MKHKSALWMHSLWSQGTHVTLGPLPSLQHTWPSSPGFPNYCFSCDAFSSSLASIPLIEILHAKHARPNFFDFLPWATAYKLPPKKRAISSPSILTTKTHHASLNCLLLRPLSPKLRALPRGPLSFQRDRYFTPFCLLQCTARYST